MKGYKPNKLFTMRDKYSSTVTYEYRGYTYDVTYSNCWTYCCTPAWVQHRDAQEKIDRALEIESKNEPNEEAVSFIEQLDEIYEMMGW